MSKSLSKKKAVKKLFRYFGGERYRLYGVFHTNNSKTDAQETAVVLRRQGCSARVVKVEGTWGIYLRGCGDFKSV